MRANIDEVPDSVDYWAKADFDHMGIIFMRVRQDVPQLWAESLDGHMEHAMSMLDEAARRVIENGYRLTLSSPAYADLALRARHPAAFQGPTVCSRHPQHRLPINPRTHYQLGDFPGMPLPCRSPFKFAKINFDGDVRLCQRFIVGNVNERTFRDIWYGEEAERVRRAVRHNPGTCVTCNHYRFCLRAGEVDLGNSNNFVALTDRSATFLDPVPVGHYGTRIPSSAGAITTMAYQRTGPARRCRSSTSSMTRKSWSATRCRHRVRRSEITCPGAARHGLPACRMTGPRR